MRGTLVRGAQIGKYDVTCSWVYTLVTLVTLTSNVFVTRDVYNLVSRIMFLTLTWLDINRKEHSCVLLGFQCNGMIGLVLIM